jgi:uncharacterized protein YndB with AHSA1/START domain
MSKNPTGRVLPIAGERALVLERTFNAPIEDVWASITESDRLARWIGRWEGEAGPGRTVSFLMTAEESAQPEDVHIVECEPPRLLRLVLNQSAGGWHVDVLLSESQGVTTLRFSQAIGEEVTDVGPGWEYYLDRLVAAREDAPMPEWDAYYPAQSAHYAHELRAASMD